MRLSAGTDEMHKFSKVRKVLTEQSKENIKKIFSLKSQEKIQSQKNKSYRSAKTLIHLIKYTMKLQKLTSVFLQLKCRVREEGRYQ